MASLQVLDLSNYNGDDKNMRIMTTDMKSLCNLEVLNLGSAQFYGDITQLFKNLLIDNYPCSCLLFPCLVVVVALACTQSSLPFTLGRQKTVVHSSRCKL